MLISFSPKLRRPSTFLVTMTVAVVAIFTGVVVVSQRAATSSFTVEQIKSYPFPNELTAACFADYNDRRLGHNKKRPVLIMIGID